MTDCDVIAAQRVERRRRARFYHPGNLGPACRFCGLRVPDALGTPWHPTCDTEARELMRLAEGVGSMR